MEGNQQKMREALEYVLHFDATDETAMEDGLTDAERIMEYADHIAECQKKAHAALSAPPRNCDVGTAEEQYKRYLAHCRRTPHCTGCKAFTNYLERCEFAWAQTPYEAQEGGAE